MEGSRGEWAPGKRHVQSRPESSSMEAENTGLSPERGASG